MFDAYEHEEVVFSNLPFDATSIIAHVKNDKLLVGSRQGHLLSCDYSAGGKRSRYDYQVSKTIEKRLINELRVVETHDLILCLTDGQLSLYDLNVPLKLLDSINKYRPISCFDFYVLEEENLLLIIIAVKRRLHLFKWLAGAVVEESLNIYLPDTPARLAFFCKWNSVVLAIKNEYFFVQICKEESSSVSGNSGMDNQAEEIGKLRSLCTTGSCPTDAAAPLIIKITMGVHGAKRNKRPLLGLCRDKTVTFIGQDGQPAREYSNCRFSDSPLSLAFDSPYLVAVLPKNIEIRSVHPPMCIQKIQLEKAIALCTAKPGNIYVCSDHIVWKLNSRALVKKNVEFLAKEKQFDLAIQLADQDESLVDLASLVEIKRKMALDFFVHKNFSECFNIHLGLRTEVLLVMNLFPQLIPDKYLAMLSKYDKRELILFEPTINLPENEKKLAVLALGDYLSEKRTECAQLLASHYKDFKEGSKDRLLPTKSLKRQEAILELVDTVLLKCYLLTKPTMVSSLLRITDNSCIISEAEKDLFEKGKSLELLILYGRKKMHKKSLDLLKKEAMNEDSQLFGMERISAYLEGLGNDNARLLFEYAPFVLKEDVELGVQIFTANDGEQSRNLDREEVLLFLKKHCLKAVIPYLEHIVFKCNEQRPKFHEELAEHLVFNIKILMKEYVHSLRDEEIRTRGGEEEGELGPLRKRLMHFLEHSKAYSPEKVLLQLDENLLEERAIIYGRLKRHEEALFIYSNVLRDFAGAERYCSSYYDEGDPAHSKVYFMLFKAYACPLEEFPSTPEFKEKFVWQKPRINVPEALRVLRKHAGEIDTVLAVTLIPLETPLNKVWEALEAVFETIKNKATQSCLMLSITQLAAKNFERKMQQMRSQKVVINGMFICAVCKAPVRNG